MNEIILLVEDDPHILRTNQRILEREGFQVICAKTLQMARDLLAECIPAAIVLDITLPDGNGIEFCEQIRSQTTAPVLFLTALDEKNELLEGLKAGGNDYITKPYDIDEFIARIKAQLRLAKMNKEAAQMSSVMTRGPIQMNTITMQAFLNDVDMMLSSKEFSLLLYLLKNEGKTLSAKEIYENVWNQPMAQSTSALWKCMSRLKNKLAVNDQICLMNFRNEGYLLEINESHIKRI